MKDDEMWLLEDKKAWNNLTNSYENESIEKGKLAEKKTYYWKWKSQKQENLSILNKNSVSKSFPPIDFLDWNNWFKISPTQLSQSLVFLSTIVPIKMIKWGQLTPIL